MKAAKISFRKRIALHLFKRFKKNEAKIHQLNYILWECTLRCNLNCLHCGSDCTKDATVKDMPIPDFLTALDQITPLVNPKHTMIVLTGGEVLVRQDIEMAGIELYKRGFPWGIVSNGMLLSEKRLNSLLNSGMRALTISLDGLEKSHNWLRNNPKSFDNALAAIRRAAKIEEIKFDVVTCVNRENYNELSELRDLLIESGVNEWRVFTIFPIGRAKENDRLQLNPEEFRGLFEFIKRTRKEGKILLNYGCEGFLGNYEKEVRDDFFFCRAGINVASVLADGSISACPNLRGNFV